MIIISKEFEKNAKEGLKYVSLKPLLKFKIILSKYIDLNLYTYTFTIGFESFTVTFYC